MHLVKRFACLFAVTAAALLTAAAPVHAAEAKGTDIADGWTIYGATVTAPGATTQHWDDSRAAAYLQSWLPASMIAANVKGGLADASAPPKKLKLYTITAQDAINGAPNQVVSYYASDGKAAWVSLPPQEIGGGAFVSQQHWFYAPARTMDAFAGRVQPIAVPPPVTSAPESPKTTKSSGSTAWIWIVGALVVVIAVIAAIFFVRRRRSASDGDPKNREREPART
jgi:hypothetical protein